jgi:hypothetical protein
MCGQIFFGDPKIKLTLIGFNWNPKKFSDPGNLYDLCGSCAETFVKKWMEGRQERQAEIEKEKLATWQARLVATAYCREKVTCGGSVSHSPAWNYSNTDQEHGARLYRSKEKQRSWRF